MSPTQPPAPERAGSVRHGLLLAGGFERFGQPVLCVLDLDDTDLAEQAVLHPLPGLPHHRIAGVVVGDGEDAPVLRGQRFEAARFLDRRCQRLVADDVDAGLQERLGHRRVQMVRRDDGDRLDAVAARRLRLRHRRVVGIAAVLGEAEREPGSPRLLGAGRERAGQQLVVVVEPGGDAMHATDEGALTASDHAEPDPPAGAARRAFRFDRHGAARVRGRASAGPASGRPCRRRSRRRPSR